MTKSGQRGSVGDWEWPAAGVLWTCEGTQGTDVILLLVTGGPVSPAGVPWDQCHPPHVTRVPVSLLSPLTPLQVTRVLESLAAGLRGIGEASCFSMWNGVACSGCPQRAADACSVSHGDWRGPPRVTKGAGVGLQGNSLACRWSPGNRRHSPFRPASRETGVACCASPQGNSLACFVSPGTGVACCGLPEE